MMDRKVDLKRLFALRYQCQDHSAHGKSSTSVYVIGTKQGEGEDYVRAGIALGAELEESADVPV